MVDIPHIPLDHELALRHAELTVKMLEQALGRRGCTTGRKKWEKQLLFSAYEVLGTPHSDRRFNLANVHDINEIQRSLFY